VISTKILDFKSELQRMKTPSLGAMHFWNVTTSALTLGDALLWEDVPAQWAFLLSIVPYTGPSLTDSLFQFLQGERTQSTERLHMVGLDSQIRVAALRGKGLEVSEQYQGGLHVRGKSA
jgi:hypothetical protein